MENAPPAAVLLDAFGTLVTFPDPAPRLRAELAARAGVDVGEAAARAAMRAEIDYYRAHHEEGRDAAAVTELRRRCGAEVARALGGAVGAAVATEALLAAIAWRAYAEVPAVLRALRDAGCRLAVVSNWDAALSDVLGALGLLPFFDVVVASAPEGRSKPDPELFRRALDRLGVAPGDAVHVGDSEEHDVRGARAAGVAPVLLCRGGGGASGGHGPTRPVRAVATLTELLAPWGLTLPGP